MSEMVERVARVLAKSNGVDPDGSSAGTFDGGSLLRGIPGWQNFSDEARLVITAMREPSEQMMHQANEDYGGLIMDKSIAKCSWRCMVDEALGDE